MLHDRQPPLRGNSFSLALPGGKTFEVDLGQSHGLRICLGNGRLIVRVTGREIYPAAQAQLGRLAQCLRDEDIPCREMYRRKRESGDKDCLDAVSVYLEDLFKREMIQI